MFFNVMIAHIEITVYSLRRSTCIFMFPYRPFTFPALTTLFYHSQLKLMFLNRVVQLSRAVDAVQFCIHVQFVAFNNIAFVWNVTRYNESKKYEQIYLIPYEEICPL